LDPALAVIVYVWAAVWVTVKVFPAMVRLALRVAVLVLATTE
jgi:hypothetical protein